MAGDWFKLHRKIIDSAIFASADLFQLSVWCLARAGFKEVWVPAWTGRGETVVHLLPGQFIFGRKVASKELKMPETTITRRMKKLSSIGFLEVKPDTHFSIVTICNWQRYQDTQNESGQATLQATDNQRSPNATGNGQATDTNKNSKKVKKDKNAKEGKEDTLGQTAGDFDRFWSVYPKKAARAHAEKAWSAAVKLGDPEAILAAAAAFALSGISKGDPKFIPHPATWLSGKRWMDDQSTWTRKGLFDDNGKPDDQSRDRYGKSGPVDF